jgi:hypothetical protein
MAEKSVHPKNTLEFRDQEAGVAAMLLKSISKLRG